MGLSDGEKKSEDMNTRFDRCTNVTDRQTHRHHMTAKVALDDSIAGQKKSSVSFSVTHFCCTAEDK